MGNYYWRGFGLLFALIALFIWYDHYDKGKELETSLIDKEPLIEARRDFREGKISFLEVFQLTNKEEGPLGAWIVPGENKIGEKILNKYTKRNRLDISFNFRLNEDQDSIGQRAYKFALKYNLEMLKLIQKSALNGTEQDNRNRTSSSSGTADPGSSDAGSNVKGENMITYDEMPEDNAELAKVEIDLPYLKNNTPESCPSSMTEILEYLSMECPNGDHIKKEDLIFLRTAKVKKTKYWIWKFFDQDGAECYVTASSWRRFLFLKNVCIGYDENYYGLTPEQYIIGDFYEVF